MNRNYYTDLPGFKNFGEFTEIANYHPLPNDWHVGITDIISSTQAIEGGMYQAVNAVSTASIIAVLNAISPIAAPYVFGGDGATLCFPTALKDEVAAALVAAKKLAAESFNLNMRVGIIPIQAILDAGHQVLVGKYQPSAHFQQAVFQGGGLQYAEILLKDNSATNPYLLSEKDIEPKANFEGFECRWSEIPSTQEETVALMIQSLPQPNKTSTNQLYAEILKKIFTIYGEESSHPLLEENLSLVTSPLKLAPETLIRTAFQGLGTKALYLLKAWISTLAGNYLMKNKVKTESNDWGDYKHQLVENTDYRKFDETLRMVLSGTEAQRQELDAHLQTEYQRGRLVYGIHASESALITCVVFNYDTEHVHFLDAANGGYAIAAQAMKKQLAEINTSQA